jgi:glycosyltransferase involved in cell wall biosynthesis
MSAPDRTADPTGSDRLELPAPRAAIEPSRRVVVAGHRLNFFADLTAALEAAGHVVAVDRWDGHRKHDEDRSTELLAWADVVICEFCLGNAVWYSARKRPGQRLLVHFHRFELDKDYPAQLAIDAVDAVVFAGPHFRDETVERLAWPPERTVHVPNPVDMARFDVPKEPDARFTLGLLGWHRRLKRLDLALDLLERLREREPRFRLRVKGSHPRDLWVWRHDDERTFFEQQLARIEATPALAEAVELEPPDDAVEAWCTRVGFILSPSDLESFHLALAEGMASRAVPVVRRRPGAAELFGEQWLHDGVEAMAEAVAGIAAGGWEAAGEAARAYVRDRYGLDVVGLAWRALVAGVPSTALSGRLHLGHDEAPSAP